MIKPILPANFYNEVNNLLVEVPENTVGIYFLTHNDKVVYVGQSIDIYNRIKQHMADYSKIFDSFYYSECVEVQLDEAEKEFIETHRPAFNHRSNVEHYIELEVYCYTNNIRYTKEDKDSNIIITYDESSMFNRKPTKKNKSTIDLSKLGEWIGNGIGGKVGFSPRRLRELEKWISERDKEDEKKVSYYRQFESLIRGSYCLRHGITISDLEMLRKLKK